MNEYFLKNNFFLPLFSVSLVEDGGWLLPVGNEKTQMTYPTAEKAQSPFQSLNKVSHPCGLWILLILGLPDFDGTSTS